MGTAICFIHLRILPLDEVFGWRKAFEGEGGRAERGCIFDEGDQRGFRQV